MGLSVGSIKPKKSASLGNETEFSSTRLNDIRGQTLYLTAGVLIAVNLVHTFLTQGLAPGLTPARIAGLIALAFFVLCPLVYKSTKKLTVSAVALLSVTLIVVLYASFANGGAPAPTMPFLIIIPFAATILISRVAGVISFAAVTVGLGFLFVAANKGMAPNSPHAPQELRALFTSSLLLTSVAIMVIAIFYENLVQTVLKQWQETKTGLLLQKGAHKHQAEENRLIKDRYELALSTADIGLWEYNIKTETLSWSELIHEILGTKAESHELKGDFIEKRLHPKDAEAIRKEMERSAIEGNTFSSVIRIETALGAYAHLKVRGGVVRAEGGSPVALAGSFMDVSAEQQSEATRHEIWDTLTSQYASASEKINTTLSIVTRHFGLQFGVVSRIEGEEYHVEYVVSPAGKVKPGDRFKYKNTYCAQTFAAHGPRGFHQSEKGALNNHPCYEKTGLEAYIGAALIVDGRRYGTLNFSSTCPRGEQFSKSDFQLIELVAHWIGYEIGREKTLNKLKESDERYDLAVRGASVGLWDWNVATNALYWSPKFKEIVGVSDNAFMPELLEFESRLHPDDHKRIMSALQAHLEKKSPYDEEYRLRHESGDYVWVHARGQAVWDVNGAPIRMAGSVDDITEIVNNREKLKRNQAELELIFNNVPARIWFKDDKNKILRLNQKAADSMGLSIEEAEGADSYELFPDMAKKYHDDDLKVINSGKPELGIIEEYKPAHNQHGWVRTDKVPYIDHETGERYVFVVSMDVTNEQETQRALQESEERYSLAASGASVGIWDWHDAHGEKETWSDQLYKLLGYEPGEIEANLKQFQALLHPDDHAATLAAVQEHFNGNKPFRAEYRLRCKGGDYKWFLGTGQAVWDEDGNPRRMIGSIMDIHELKVAEQMKNEFVSTVSHELRTPMTSITGAIELVRSQKFGELPEKASQLLDIAAKNGARLIRLINDILDIEKIEAGKLELNLQNVDVKDLVEEAVRQIEAFAQFHQAELTLHCEIPDAIIHVDPDRMMQVLTNLMSNAAKFTGKDGKIEVLIKSDNDTVSIAVKDNGHGIPSDKLGKIFDHFTQVDASDKRAQQGTGLGLAISKAIVEALGERLDVESEVGVGSIFTVHVKRSVLDAVTEDNSNDETTAMREHG